MASATIADENYVTQVSVRDHSFKMDEPTDKGGQNAGATPTEHLAAALASCTVITLRMYTARKEWHMGEIQANVERKMNAATKQNIFEVDITYTNELDEKQHERVLKIAHACPVHKMLQAGNEIRVTLTKR